MTLRALSRLVLGVGLTWTAPTLNADGTPLTDLARYRFYRSLDRANWIEIAEAPSSATEWTAPTPPPNRTHYFYMTAIDEAGNESGPSNEISLRVTSVCLKRCSQ